MNRRRTEGGLWGSIQLFSVSGIPIRIHITFFLFLAWIAVMGRSNTALSVGYMLAVFGCVLLHELGHALTAQRYGIKTRDITLYPIGGVAMLESRPKPLQELIIAIAGPLVNVVIAGVLLIYLVATNDFRISTDFEGLTFAQMLLLANILLVVFNMIPAFPMDGGRVLRAALSLGMPEVRATQIAAGIGQLIALGMGLLAIINGDILLLLVAFFVFLGASQEVASSVARSFISNKTVADAMIRNYESLPNGANLEQAAQRLLAGSQTEFPITAGDEVVGVLTRADIARGLSAEGGTAYVAGFMNRDFRRADPGMSLEAAAELFGQGDHGPVLVFEGEQMVGMLTQENLSELIMLEHARSRQRPG
jgi:Zn-dependent protease